MDIAADSYWQAKTDGIRVRVRVRAGSGVNAVVGPRNDELVVKVRSPAQKGRANRDLIAYMAKVWGVPKHGISLMSGLRSAHKVLALSSEYRAAFQEWFRRQRQL